MAGATPLRSPSQAGYNYSFATAPDIIRSAEKDRYFQDVLFDRLSSLLRRGRGSRFVQMRSTDIRTFADLVYFACTTLIANRTLGEEYCDIVQVESRGRRLPALRKRFAYIFASVLLPYTFGKLAPQLRNLLDTSWTANLQSEIQNKSLKPSLLYRIKVCLLLNRDAITSTSLLYGVGTAVFYLTGTYYHLSKRLLGLRYIFTNNGQSPSEQTSYEVLGILLFLQLSVQAWLRGQQMLHAASKDFHNGDEICDLSSGKIESFLPQIVTRSSEQAISPLEFAHTHAAQHPHITLAEPTNLKWIQGMQQRKCTLCLEESKNPSVTTCGHVFCWTCIKDWIKEKPECPLCRQSIQAQHVLPLR